ncbi:DUF637 domain-containing protein, partial [Parendozoicomonas sp. Alg238-R29]|uniref:DUF637 domain-containing protein n=1 Tax=Parendozoicomonas sp. Alg238-R29 TaxID=2993446 RepID=UPI00248DDDC5
GTVWQKSSGEGRTDETVVHTEIITPELTIAAQRIEADFKGIEGLTLQESVKQLSQNPELAWMTQLENDPRVDWNRMQEIHDQWDYESEGLTGPAAAVIAIAVAFVAGPYAAALAEATAAGVAVTAGASAAAELTIATVMEAAYMSIASQASVSLINNKGDIGSVMQELGSSDSVKKIATAMATAGLFRGDIAPNNNVWSIAKNIAYRSAVNASIDTAVNGGSLGDNLVDSLQQVIVQQAAASAANAIGGVTDSGSLENIAAHAALGCVAAEAGGDDCGSGALGGAVSARVAPIAAEWIGSKEQVRKVTFIAEFAAGLSALVTGKDVSAATGAARNEVLNNYGAFSGWLKKVRG